MISSANLGPEQRPVSLSVIPIFFFKSKKNVVGPRKVDFLSLIWEWMEYIAARDILPAECGWLWTVFSTDAIF